MSKKKTKEKVRMAEKNTEQPEQVTAEPESNTAESAAGEPDLAKELADYKDKYLRTMAEFENFRKRSSNEKADWIRHATKQLALEICDVVDNFERALQTAKAEDLESSFGKGIVLIEKQLVRALEKESVKKIEALGEIFNPEIHDALAHIASDFKENTVAAIIQNGYTMHDKVIRPVGVAVSNGKKMNTQED